MSLSMARPGSARTLRVPVLAVALALALSGCPEGENGGQLADPDEYFYDCQSAPAGVTVFATDESYAEIANKEAAGAVTINDREAATVAAPASGSLLAPGTPPVFTIQPPATAARAPGRRPDCPTPPSVRSRRWWRWLSPIGIAHAHCPGVTGDNYVLRLTP